MLESYDFKLIKSGKEIEVYKYRDTKIKRGYERKRKHKRKLDKYDPLNEITKWDLFTYQKNNRIIEEERQIEEILKKQKSRFSIGRTRTNIRRLANSNPQLKKFLTLTFAKSTTELKKANYLFNQAMKRILRRLPEFEYMAVVEFQKDIDYHGNLKPNGGSVHYHLLCNMAMPETKNIQELFDWEKWFALRYWKNGFIKIKNIEQVNNMGAYFCKYLGKDMTDTRMFGKKKFFCSQNLKKPIELIKYPAIDFYENYVCELNPNFEKIFYSDYAGTIEYSAYTLPEDVSDLNIETKTNAILRPADPGVSTVV